MKKIITASFLLILLISFSSCTKKTIFLTPEAIGYLYNNQTKKPIANYNGYIGYDTSRSNHNFITTDSKGKFKIPSEEINYYIIKPNLTKWNMSAAHIYIQFPGYMTKIYDYSKEVQNINSDYKLGKINLGVVFLDPEK